MPERKHKIGVKYILLSIIIVLFSSVCVIAEVNEQDIRDVILGRNNFTRNVKVQQS